MAEGVPLRVPESVGLPVRVPEKVGVGECVPLREAPEDGVCVFEGDGPASKQGIQRRRKINIEPRTLLSFFCVTKQLLARALKIPLPESETGGSETAGGLGNFHSALDRDDRRLPPATQCGTEKCTLRSLR